MDEAILEQLDGYIVAVLFTNDENGYAVLKVNEEEAAGDPVTVTGYIPDPVVGEKLNLQGSWIEHRTYGRQFKAEMASRELPDSLEGIREYLAGNAIRGIGDATALLIVNRFGAGSFDVIENSPEALTEIKGISLTKALDISEQFRQKNGLRRLLEFFNSEYLEIRPIIAMRLYRYYGNESILLIRENPFIIADELIGGTFTEADSLAQSLGFENESAYRVKAGIVFEMLHNLKLGHCFAPEGKLVEATSRAIGVEPDRVAECLAEMYETGSVVCEEINEIKACYLPELYEAERYTASRLLSMKDRIQVITGGPGTGKTTSVIKLLERAQQEGYRTYLAAPTGRAAKRMTEVTGTEAYTVHRLLGATFEPDGKTVVFEYNESNKLDCGVMIVDECSMIDIILFKALLEALPDTARLILVGDVDQLPPVGPGKVFRNIIESEVFNVTRLTEIFRQSEGSRIVQNAHLVNNGEYPDFSDNSGDFFRLKRLDGASSVETIAELCSTRLPQKMNLDPSDIQVLSPARRGELGTLNLNRQLQAVLNPQDGKKNEKTFGETVFRTGDRVMQIKNNYDVLWRTEDNSEAGQGIFNGDIGYIRSMDMNNETLEIDFDGRIAVYAFANLFELEHAWAITVHKSQGCEYKAVIFALNNSSKFLLTRDVFYTGITRARDLLILVGNDDIAKQMIDNRNLTKRYSFLKYRLKNLDEVF